MSCEVCSDANPNSVTVSPINDTISEFGLQQWAEERLGEIDGASEADSEGNAAEPEIDDHCEKPEHGDVPEAATTPDDGTADDPAFKPEDDQGLEARAPKIVASPDLPSQAEIDVHNAMGHALFRSWCEACVTGQGREAGHRAKKSEER